jgi:hypothetical protein
MTLGDHQAGDLGQRRIEPIFQVDLDRPGVVALGTGPQFRPCAQVAFPSAFSITVLSFSIVTPERSVASILIEHPAKKSANAVVKPMIGFGRRIFRLRAIFCAD